MTKFIINSIKLDVWWRPWNAKQEEEERARAVHFTEQWTSEPESSATQQQYGGHWTASKPQESNQQIQAKELISVQMTSHQYSYKTSVVFGNSHLPRQ